MQKAIEYIRTELQGFFSKEEIQQLTYLFFEKLTGLSRTQLLINKNTIFSNEQRKDMESFVEKLKKNIPVQYILGYTEFYRLKFDVNDSVLIPRPETEELVEWIVEENQTNLPLRILDIGTGSGCIAISLKYIFKQSVVCGYDVSARALTVAKANAHKNKLDVFFDEIDILNAETNSERWDIIVSNPPYIPEREKVFMHDNVLKYEPHVALFVSNDEPLLFYRKIAEYALVHLKKQGKLYFEIHYDAGKAVVSLLQGLGFEKIELRKDLEGKDRMIRAVV